MSYPSDLARTKNWGTETLTDADLELQYDVIINWIMAFANLTSGHDHSGVANKGSKLSPANLKILNQAIGDILYADTVNSWARLAKGNDGQALVLADGIPSWGGIGKDAILRGFEVVFGTTAYLTVNAGTLFNGGTLIDKVANTDLALATAADWYDGNTHSYAGGAGLCYVGVDGEGNIKLLGANPPNKADASGNTAGDLLYYYDGAKYWRVLPEAVHIATNNTFDLKWFRFGNFVGFDVPPSLTTSVSNGQWSSALSIAGYIPATSIRAKFGCLADGANVHTQGVNIRPNGSNFNASIANGVGGHGTASGGTSLGSADWRGELDSFTDASQQVQYYNFSAGAIEITLKGYYINTK